MKLLQVCSGVLILCLLPALPDTANGQAEPRLPDGAPASAASRPALTAAAAWELRLLGCDTPEKMAELRIAPKLRRVRVAIVGQDGVSRTRLEHLLRGSNTLTYHGCSDPERNTHDTQMACVVLELTNPLGVSLDLHVWQAGPDFADYARKFRIAARKADIVALFQSFWGPDTGLITRAIRESPQALFVSPYVEYGGKPTSHTPQGSACRPWDPDTIAHFVTVAPLARRGPAGVVVTPSDRGPDDTEIINFLAPSYHANGPGGTCPSAAVAVACAAYLWAVALDEPQPTGIIAAMRDGATFDRELLAATPEFDTASIERLATQLERLRRPSAGRRRLLDADGILNLYRARHLLLTKAQGSDDGTQPATGMTSRRR